MTNSSLQLGTPAPWFVARSPENPRFHLDTAAGRYLVLCFLGSAAEPASRQAFAEFAARRDVFDDVNASFFAVSIDPSDESSARLAEAVPGIRLFWDFDRRVSRLYGAAPAEGDTYQPFTVILDERLRVFALVPLGEQPQNHVAQVLQALATLPPIEPARLARVPAPVLVVPRIFEPELCRALMQYYELHGGEESGFMRSEGEQTVRVFNPAHKQRRDQEIGDERLRQACMFRIHDRLIPEIQRAFQFRATRIERYTVACYDAETGGHFRAHRDNTTKGTAHRRFAVSLVLNAGEFTGGNLRFPEFGRDLYAPPTGGAVVFSCSLLHEATPVTHGKRFVFLPFLYDDAAAQIRQENLRFLEQGNPPLGE